MPLPLPAAVSAIRAADSDGNPDTRADPTWTPLVTTPPIPDQQRKQPPDAARGPEGPHRLGQDAGLRQAERPVGGAVLQRVRHDPNIGSHLNSWSDEPERDLVVRLERARHDTAPETDTTVTGCGGQGIPAIPRV